MQQSVRDVSNVIDWMGGTRQLLEKDDPQFKAAAMQRFQLTDAEWEAKRQDLLEKLNASIANAQSQATRSIQAAVSPSSKPFVPAEKFGAAFQSAMEEHVNDRVTSTTQAEAAGVPTPFGPPEKFDSGDPGWAIVLVARLDEAFKGKHVFVHSNDLSVFRYDMPPNASVALFGDWATGEPPALSIKATIERQSPDYTIHLGDTYYAGFEDEIRHNLVACWPGKVQPRKSFTLNGNHEMYSGGNAYFNALPLFGQSASYFNLGNQYWRLIALDTSYPERNGDSPAQSWGELVDMELPNGTQVREVDWLAAQVEHARSFDPPARIILLTHHQLFSAFDGDALGKYLLPQIKPFLDKGDIYAWFWGHEHRGIVYGPNATSNVKARCIGHAGFPQPPSSLKDAAHVAQFPIAWLEDRTEPDNAWYGMRGFALLRLAGKDAWVDYIDETGSKRYSEQL
ncbi:MAG TPA: metallophosphoesterase [Terriglobia bacterium]|nr:metallophosphoesterase [Terriglobia bacterium]